MLQKTITPFKQQVGKESLRRMSKRHRFARAISKRLKASQKAKYGPGKLKRKLMSLRSRIALAAQRVYDQWDPEDEWGSGGICDEVCDAMSDIVATSVSGVDIDVGGQPGSDHAPLLVYTDDEAYIIDIPASTYERGSGYSWEKIPDVRIRASDVQVYAVDRRNI